MIVLLSILISSQIIYNSVGTIDENSLNDISFIFIYLEQ